MTTSGIVSGMFIFSLFNKEQLTWDKVISVPICVVGVFLVLQPPFLFHHRDVVTSGTFGILEGVNETSNPLQYIIPHVDIPSKEVLSCILSLATGIIITINIALVKHYNDFFTPKNTFVSLIWSYASGTAISLIPVAIFETPVFPVEVKPVLLVSGHVVTYVFVMPLLMYGSQLISGNLGSIIMTTRLLFLLVGQYLFLVNIYPGNRNWIEVTGVLLVSFGSVFSYVIEMFTGLKRQE